MSTRLALSMLAFTALLGGCDATISEPYTEQLSSVAVSYAATCGVTAEGVALCWGEGASGYLGDGTGISHSQPLPVASGARFTQLVAGSAHICGLGKDGRAFCWGDNHEGQIGEVDGDLDCVLRQTNGWDQDFGNDCSAVPVPLKTNLRFKALGAGDDQTCGLTSGGEIWCWGSSYYGLGDSLTYSSAAPVKVKSTAHFRSIAIGANHSCAADDDGLGWCWGYGGYGATGLGSADSLNPTRLVPTQVATTAYFRTMAVGTDHSCGLTSSGDLICWGAGYYGQRGDSSSTQIRHTPAFVKTDRVFTAIAAGGARTCAIESGTKAAWCWGYNVDGALGTGIYGSNRLAPALVLGGLQYHSLSIASHGGGEPGSGICGRTGDGLYCWGQVPLPLTFEE